MTYEWMIARRYIMPEGRLTFVFVMALVSIFGVALGVASLITVLSVMNGFGDDLRSKILGHRSHLLFQAYQGLFLPEIPGLAEAFEEDPNVEAAAPLMQFEGMIQPDDRLSVRSFVVIRGIQPSYQTRVNDIGSKLLAGSLERLERTPQSLSQSSESEDGSIPFYEVKKRKQLPGIVIGRELARSLYRIWIPQNASAETLEKAFSSQTLGKVVRLTTTPRKASVMGFANASVQKFEVVGVFSTGHYDYDLGWLYIGLTEGQRLAQAPNELSHFEMRLKESSAATTGATARRVNQLRESLLVDTVQERLLDLRAPENKELADWLKARYDSTAEPESFGPPPVDISGLDELHGYSETWMEFNRIFFRALLIEKKVMGYILAMIVLVATFSILTTLFMVVMIKTRDVGVLRALGASKGGILRVFISVGLFIGVLGTILGVGLGLGVCEFIERVPIVLPGEGQIYYLEYLPVAVRPLDILNVTLYTISISFLTTILPALRAAKLDPTRCLRST